MPQYTGHWYQEWDTGADRDWNQTHRTSDNPAIKKARYNAGNALQIKLSVLRNPVTDTLSRG